MTADSSALDELSKKLWHRGLAGFLATTLSSPAADLLPVLDRLGGWIRRGKHPGSLPLGIHLEGPFLSPHAAGAHPPGVIRPVTLKEILALWQASQETLKIITLAPEAQNPAELKKVVNWAKRSRVKLSIGHTHATQAEANRAFNSGFSGVTHAWNAMAFHHRNPGVLGASLGRAGVHVEVILDGIHVDSTLIRWVRKLHPDGTCFVSDCAPAAALREGQICSFGPLSVAMKGGACRLEDGTLAGGGKLLPEIFSAWVKQEAHDLQLPLDQLLRQTLKHLCDAPLLAIGMSKKTLSSRKVLWEISRSGKIQIRPL